MPRVPDPKNRNTNISNFLDDILDDYLVNSVPSPKNSPYTVKMQSVPWNVEFVTPQHPSGKDISSPRGILVVWYDSAADDVLCMACEEQPEMGGHHVIRKEEGEHLCLYHVPCFDELTGYKWTIGKKPKVTRLIDGS